MKVLLVDDDVQIRTAISHLLLSQGVHIVTANDGLDAVDHLQDEPAGFDLVISDVEMPRLDGWGLLAWARRHRGGLPVVLMSGMSGISFVNAASQRGASGALEKPFLASQLRRLIESLFDRQSGSGRQGFYYQPSLATQIGLAAVCA